MTSYYDTDREPPDPDDAAQPDDFCDCRPGTELRKPHQHAADCLRWRPPLTGPGSTDEHRAQALAHIRAVLADARRRNETHAQTEESTR